MCNGQRIVIVVSLELIELCLAQLLTGLLQYNLLELIELCLAQLLAG